MDEKGAKTVSIQILREFPENNGKLLHKDFTANPDDTQDPEIKFIEVDKNDELKFD